jgi:hypothetical protein
MKKIKLGAIRTLHLFQVLLLSLAYMENINVGNKNIKR